MLFNLKNAGAVIVLLLAANSLVAQQFPSPGPEHQELKNWVGQWNVDFKGADGSNSKGTSTFTMECGGFWLASDFRCNLGGLDFHGKGMDGYDPAKKKYVSVWVDSLVTYPMIFEGNYDDKKEKLVMHAEAALQDGKPGKWRSVTTKKSKDHITFEMFATPSGSTEQLMMTIEYTRKK